jgi:hypothetical protein
MPVGVEKAASSRKREANSWPPILARLSGPAAAGPISRRRGRHRESAALVDALERLPAPQSDPSDLYARSQRGEERLGSNVLRPHSGCLVEASPWRPGIPLVISKPEAKDNLDATTSHRYPLAQREALAGAPT